MSLKDFEIIKALGKGAFGSVCLAKRKEDNKTYAIKQVKIAQLSVKERESALNEIRILASLSHKNIVGYNEAFYDDMSKTLNIVMEYADDGDIDSKIKANAKQRLAFQESTIWLWLIQILQGWKYLHDNKIMHRDIKCANVFLWKNGLLKIGDLNVSKVTKMGMASTQTGTPYYASPEIWKDQPYDYKCDIWSVGCIIYEICTLSPPFRGTSLKNLYENIKRGVYSPIPSRYSRDLAKIISMILVVDPRLRPSATDLLNLDIIQKRMEEVNRMTKDDLMENQNDNHAELIKTIKLTRNVNEINKNLPAKRYKKKKKKEEEMMCNDEFETKKAGFFKEIAKEINNTPNNNNQPQPQNVIMNKPVDNKYAYLNNYDKNMNKINAPSSQPQVQPQPASNVHQYVKPEYNNPYGKGVNIPNYQSPNSNHDNYNDVKKNQIEYNQLNAPSNPNVYNQYNSPSNQIDYNKYQRPSNPSNSNKRQIDDFLRKEKENQNLIDQNKQLYAPGNRGWNSNYLNNNPSGNPSNQQVNSNKNEYYDPISMYRKNVQINSNQNQNPVKYGDNNAYNQNIQRAHNALNNNNKMIPSSNNRPPSSNNQNNKIVIEKPKQNYRSPQSRPISGSNRPISGNNNNIYNRNSGQDNRLQKQPVPYKNPYLEPAGRPSNNIGNRPGQRKVVYEKMDYQAYMQKNKPQPQNNYQKNIYGAQPRIISGKDNVRRGNGAGNYGYIQQGPRIVNIKK